jgi:hypothetical protein
MILWAFQCIADGIAGLQPAWRAYFRRRGQVLPLDAAIGGGILVVFAGVSIILAAQRQYPPAAGLRGATWLHLPAAQATEFEAIAGAVGANCSILFTMPGMYSFNLWSGVPTPNGWNLSAWMEGIDREEQSKILDIIRAHPRACVVLNHEIEKFWDRRSLAYQKAPPLMRYIETEMPMAAKFGDYEIRVHPRRMSPWRDAGGQARSG